MTINRKHKTIGIRGLLVVSALAICGGASYYLFSHSEKQVEAAYPATCVSQACREAYDRAAIAEQNAAAAAASAQTLEGEIARLNLEIEALENEITTNRAIADDLSNQIAEKEAKLDLQQTALAKLLIDMHFENEPDAITLLAGSSSLGDLAEKQSRQTTAKNQVATSAKAVRELKEDLEKQKAKVDQLIGDAELRSQEVARKKNEQEVLKQKYENDSEAYARDAAEKRKQMQEEMAKYASGGTIGTGVNTYPFADRCPQDDSSYLVIGGFVCQCVSYTAWKVQEFWGIYISGWGNARDWGSYAAANGYTVDNTPTPFSVGYTEYGIYGHVVWVESVNSNGTINLTEYNNAYSAGGIWGTFGARNGVPASEYHYIHFN